MKYRVLGKSNLRVSVIGIGTWQFGGEWAKDFSQADATAILARGRELGLNLIVDRLGWQIDLHNHLAWSADNRAELDALLGKGDT